MFYIINVEDPKLIKKFFALHNFKIGEGIGNHNNFVCF